MSFTTWLLRKTFKAGDDKRDAGLTTPEDICRFDDIVYGTDPKWQVLDVYRPKAETGRLPVIVSIHGGGWTYGDKERYQYYCMSLAQRGFAAVNFTYRLAPEFKFPAGLEDTNLVFTWVLNNAETYGFDTEHVFVVGDSAGGHMASLYSAICTNPAFAAGFPFTVPKLPNGDGFAPTGLGLNCGVYEIDMQHSNGMTKSLMKALLPKGGTAEEMKQINVVPQVTAAFPPSFVMTANKDPLAGPPAHANLVRKLKELKIAFVDKTYGSPENPQGHVFHCDMRNETGKLCNDEECNWFRTLIQ